MKINFLHVPKTAGISFFQFLEECFCKGLCIRFGTEADVELFREWTNLEVLDSFDVVSGHLTLQDLMKNNLVRPDRPTLAFLRDPVERLVSEFLYWDETKRNSSLKMLDKDKVISDLIDYLSNKRSPPQNEYFCLDKPVCNFNDYIEYYSTYIFSSDWFGPVATVLKNALDKSFFPMHANKTDRDWLSPELLEDISAETQLYAKRYLVNENEFYASAKASSLFTLEAFRDFLSREIPTYKADPPT